ncbi:hypothetical protein PVAP13_1KG000733 [Panicum virgatum]|uniref:Single-stranded DNA binding protein Ssb-like OB fold domain-containing protein n=1 Tax=Panicum virgatum TaxID=38727 RepID=A0A8T0X5A6_PANVG|nr:hypothetical protein PVAP13_1KG000733 [Panicum virgatum]KAG2655271.1 hypothetical protein PVAP13_1KG000733 [Panicum virgatum]
MAADSGARRQPTFTKVDQLRPGTLGHNLIVKVVNSKMVLQRGREGGLQGRQMRIAECLVGMKPASSSSPQETTKWM